MVDEQDAFHLSRVRTGIPGLDAVLGGGLFDGSSTLVVGAAGTGKTIFGTQMAFHHVRRGGRVLYMTLLTEAHSRLLAHLSTMSYFDPAIVGDGLYVVSGAKELSARGLKGLALAIRRLVHQRRATLFVLDGLSIVEETARSVHEFQRFIHEVNTMADMSDCTVVLLANIGGSEAGPERVIVDSILLLREDVIGVRALRSLRVLKMRGSEHVGGMHPFRIDRRGARVFPRFETTVTRRRRAPVEERRRLSTGVSGLDEMLMGGVVASSTTLLLGPPGCGKTLLGLGFLAAGAEHGEPGVYCGFYESPSCLLAKGDGAGMRLTALVEEGKLTLCWQAPIERIIDDLVRKMLAVVKRTGARRLFIDGLDGLALSAVFPMRLPTFFTALGNALRARGVTTFFSQEAALFRPESDVPLPGLSATVDNILVLRYVEHEAHVRRLLSILKSRDSAHDSSLRELEMTSRGIVVSPTFESAQAILSGSARQGEARALSASTGQRPRGGGRQ